MRTLAPDPVVTDGFDGIVMADDEIDHAQLVGRRVAVVGETARYLRVLPEVVPHAALTKLFVTRPVDVLPPTPLGLSTQLVGPLGRAVARAYRWRTLPERELRRKLTPLGPDVPRVVAPGFHRVVQDHRCQVVAWPVAGIVPVGVRTGDGLEHHVDVLITC